LKKSKLEQELEEDFNMLKDLVKLANRLDSLGLIKEADFLDAILRKISIDQDGGMVAKNPMDIKKRMLDISRIRDDNADKQAALKKAALNKIKEEFEESCIKLRTKIIETLKPIDAANPIDFLDLFMPGKDAGIDAELADFFTEESIDETSFMKLENVYNPEDMINAAVNIENDSYSFPDTRKIGRSLRESFERISEKIFMPKMNSRI